MKIMIKSLLVLILTGGASLAQENTFYQGKTLQILVGYSAGGGYDQYARTLARHISKHIPGNPNVVVRNVPGAGSVVLMNQLANTLPNDGTVIGTVARGLPFDPLFTSEAPNYNALEMGWLGSLNSETGIGVTWHTTEVHTWEDLFDQTLTLGATARGADSYVFPAVIAQLLGFNYNIVTGYPGVNDILLAMERGEVDAPGSWSYDGAIANNPDWFSDGQIRILYQSGLSKHPNLPDVPLVTDLVDNDTARQVLRLLFARNEMGRPFVAPPNIPQDRLEILRRAMEATSNDPEFVNDINNQGLNAVFMSGQAIEDVIKEAYTYSQEVISIIADTM